jgi:F-type H+-transporting ATPase subunit b
MFFGPLAEEPSATALIVHPFWVFVSVVNFLFLLFVLRTYMWGPLTRMLDTRATKIREGLQMAEEAKAERLRMQAEVERLLTQARLEATALAEKSIAAAEAAAAELRTQARSEADRIREKGRTDAQALHDQALAQLRTEVANMVILAASRILGREISPDQHRALIEESLSEAGAELQKN